MEVKFFTGKWRIAAYSILALLALWFVVRACTRNNDLEKSYYTVGRDSSWYPLDLRGKDHNMVGFTTDLLKKIAAENGIQIQIVDVSTGSLYDNLQLGRYDAALSSLTPNIMTEQTYAFSDPFYRLGPVLVVTTESSANSLQDMEGKIVGIESGAFDLYTLPEDQTFAIIPYKTHGMAFENLNRGVIDGVLADVLIAYTFTQRLYEDRLKVVTSPLLDRGIRLLTLNQPHYIPFLSRVDEALQKFKMDGTYDQLLEKWNLIKTERDTQNEK